jgi:hypothetical protein
VFFPFFVISPFFVPFVIFVVILFVYFVVANQETPRFSPDVLLAS